MLADAVKKYDPKHTGILLATPHAATPANPATLQRARRKKTDPVLALLRKMGQQLCSLPEKG